MPATTVPYEPTAQDNAVGVVPLSNAEADAIATGKYQPGQSLDHTEPQVPDAVKDPVPAPEIPEKFRGEDGKLNADALLKSYQELERKLGAPKEPDIEPDTEPAIEPPEPETAGLDDGKFHEFAEKITQKGGLDDDDYAKLAKDHGISRQMAETYVQGFQAQVEQARTALYQQAGIKDDAEFGVIAKWAVDNLTKAEQDAFDKAVRADNGAGAAWALQGLKARYTQANGRAPNLVRGETSRAQSGYQSREAYLAELDKATRTNDPGLHAQIQRKLAAMDTATRRSWMGGIDPNTTGPKRR